MKKIFIGIFVLTSFSILGNETCVDYKANKKIKKICANVDNDTSVVFVQNPRLVDTNGIDWSIGKGLFPKIRAEKICKALGIETSQVLSYRVDHLGQEQANVNLKGSTLTSTFDAITEIECLEDK